MALLCAAGEAAGLTEPGTTGALLNVLEKYHLPHATDFSAQELATAALLDKKSAGNTIRLILLKKLGEGVLYPCPMRNLRASSRKEGRCVPGNAFPTVLRGRVRVPPSKSQAHRSMICAALSGGRCSLSPFALSKDMEATLRALSALGVSAGWRGKS